MKKKVKLLTMKTLLSSKTDHSYNFFRVNEQKRPASKEKRFQPDNIAETESVTDCSANFLSVFQLKYSDWYKGWKLVC